MMEIKRILSMPKTISKKVKVKKAPMISGLRKAYINLF